MKKILIYAACFVNRNLRYGDSSNKLLQFFVIRTRFYLKKYIDKNIEAIQKLGTVKIKIKHAGIMELQTHDYVDRWLFTGGDFEPPIVRLFLKYFHKGNNLLDIGANIGYFTLIGAKLAGSAGKVYAVEPSPSTTKKLERNIELNNVCNIEIFKKAVSNKKGAAVFRVPCDEIKNSGRASLRTIEENHINIEVETITVDSQLERFETIHLTKMDIEGAEAMALEGMTNLIRRDQPFLIIELSDYYLRQLGYSADYILDYLRQRNYKIYIAGEEIRPVNVNEELSNYQSDIFCVPASKTI